MARRWAEVAQDPRFREKPPEEQEALRLQYFNEVVVPKIPAEEVPRYKALYDTDTAHTVDGYRPPVSMMDKVSGMASSAYEPFEEFGTELGKKVYGALGDSMVVPPVSEWSAPPADPQNPTVSEAVMGLSAAPWEALNRKAQERGYEDPFAWAGSKLPQPVNPPVDPATGQPTEYDPAVHGPLPSTGEKLAAGGRNVAGSTLGGANNIFLRYPDQLSEIVSPTPSPADIMPADPENPTITEVLGALMQAPRAILNNVSDEIKGVEEGMVAPIQNEEFLPDWQRNTLAGTRSLGHMMTPLVVGGQSGVLPMMHMDVSASETDQLKKQGYSDAGAFFIGNLHGGAEIVGEKTALGPLFKKWGKGWMAELAKFVALETGQETITESLQATLDKMTTDPNMTWGEFKERYTDMLQSLPVSLGGVAATARTMQELGRAQQGEGLPGSDTRKVTNQIMEELQNIDPATVAKVAQSMHGRATQTEPMGEATPSEIPKQQAPKQVKPDPNLHIPPISEPTQAVIDEALSDMGYAGVQDVPDDQLQSVYETAIKKFEKSLIESESSQTMFELENLRIGERNKQPGKKPRQSVSKPALTKGSAISISLQGAESEKLGEQGTRALGKAKVVAEDTDEVIASFSEPVERYGIEAGHKVTIRKSDGAVLTGFGTGAAASARTGVVVQRGEAEPTRARFSKKKGLVPGKGNLQDDTPRTPEEIESDWQQFLDEKEDYSATYQRTVGDAYDEAFFDVMDGNKTIKQAAAAIAAEFGYSASDVEYDLREDFGIAEGEEMTDVRTKEEDRPAAQADFDETDWYKKDDWKNVAQYYERTFVDYDYRDEIDLPKRQKTKRGRSYTSYWFDERGPAWALDSHLADDAEGEITSGGVDKLMPDIKGALIDPPINDLSLRVPLNKPEADVLARVLRKMVDNGFPRAVIRSINAFAHQREKPFVHVSGAYDGKYHEVRFADYVLNDMRDERKRQSYQKALRFLMSHELTHAIEADRNEHTLSMDSPLFHIDADSFEVAERTSTYQRYDYKTKKHTPVTTTYYDVALKVEALGPVIREMVEVYNGKSDVGRVLSYPYGSLTSAAKLKGKAQQKELNRIRAESFAQMGAIYYTYPELAEKHFPEGFKLFKEISKYANHTDRAARRKSLRVPLQLQGARGSVPYIREETGADVEESTETGQEGPDSRLARQRRHGGQYPRGDTRSRVLRDQAEAAADYFDARRAENKETGNLHKRFGQGSPFTYKNFASSDGTVATNDSTDIGPVVVRGYWGLSDGLVGGKGSYGMFHTLYDFHEYGDNFVNDTDNVQGFAWDSEEQAMREIKRALTSKNTTYIKDGPKTKAVLQDTSGNPITVIMLKDIGKSDKKTGVTNLKILTAFRAKYEDPMTGRARQAEAHPDAAQWHHDVTEMARKAMRGSKVLKIEVHRHPDSQTVPGPVLREIQKQEAADPNIRESVEGMYHDGEVHLFTDNIREVQDDDGNVLWGREEQAFRIILHEGTRGHYVIAQYFGYDTKQYNTLMDDVYDMLKDDAEFKDMLNALDMPTSTPLNRRVAAEEYIAQQVEVADTDQYDEKLASPLEHLIERFMQYIRKLMNYLGIKTELGDRQLRVLLDKAAYEVHKQGNVYEGKTNQRARYSTRTVKNKRRKTLKGMERVRKGEFEPETIELSDERPHLLPGQDKLPFYSQLHARAAVEAPKSGTVKKYREWVKKAIKSGENIIIDIGPVVEAIERLNVANSMKWLKKWDKQENQGITQQPDVFMVTKKQVTKLIKNGKFKGYIQANGPNEAPAGQYIAYLKDAQRAFRGGVVKAEEADWSGLNDLFDMLGDEETITREELSTFLNDHKLLLRDVYADNTRFSPKYGKYGVITSDASQPYTLSRPAFEYLYMEELDEDVASEEQQRFYDENEDERTDEARDSIDRGDFIDDEALQEAIRQRAEELAEEWNDEHEEAIDANEEDERDAEDYWADAEGELDASDYIDEESYFEAQDEAVQEALTNLEREAEDHGDDYARADIREVFREPLSGWSVVGGGENERQWDVFDNDWNVVDEGYYSFEDAVAYAQQQMDEQEIEYETESYTPSRQRRDAAPDTNSAGDTALQTSSQWDQYTVGSTNYRSLLMQVPIPFDTSKIERPFVYTTHWRPQNINVYVRLSDVQFQTKDGETHRALNIEELQGDWYQIGDVIGYGNEGRDQLQHQLLSELSDLRKVRKVEYERQLAEAEEAGRLQGYIIPVFTRREWDAMAAAMESTEMRAITDSDDEFYPAFRFEVDSAITTNSFMKRSFIVRKIKALSALLDDQGYALNDREFVSQHSFDEWMDAQRVIAALHTGQHVIRDVIGDSLSDGFYKRFDRLIERDVDSFEGRVDLTDFDAEMERLTNTQKIKRDYVPLVPMRTTYTAAILKRVARLAVDEGYGAIVLTPADAHSAKRWGSDIFMWTKRDFNEKRELAAISQSLDGLKQEEEDIRFTISKAEHHKTLVLKDIDQTIGFWEAERAKADQMTEVPGALDDAFYDDIWALVFGPQKGGGTSRPETVKQYTKQAYATIERELRRARRTRLSQAAEYREGKHAAKRRLRQVQRKIAKAVRQIETLSKGGRKLPEGHINVLMNNRYNDVLYSKTVEAIKKSDFASNDENLALVEDSVAKNYATELTINLTTREGLDKLKKTISESIGYGVQQYGHEGNITRATTEKFFEQFLRHVANKPEGGVIFRRGGGLATFYNSKLVGKSEGMRLLDKNTQIGSMHQEREGPPADHNLIYSQAVGVVITDEFKKKWGRGTAQFSRRSKHHSKDRRILKKVGKKSSFSALFDKLHQPKRALSEFKDYFLQKALNTGLPFQRMVAQIGDVKPTDDPYIAWRLLAGDAPIIEDWLGINPKTRGTVPFRIEDRIAGHWGRSLSDILAPVMVDSEALKDFEEYIIARRARELMALGKERLYTEEDIRYGMSLETPQYKAIAKELYAYNDALIQYAVDGGFLSAEVATKFRRYSNYIPFFREAEHEGDVGGYKRGSAFKRLTGGSQNIRDPLQNIIDNTASIIHATNRNAAIVKALQLAETRTDGKRWMERVPLPKQAVQLTTQRVVDSLKSQGINIDIPSANEISYMQTFFQNRPIGDEKSRTIVLKENGQAIAVKVYDNAIWDALHAMAPMELGLLIDILAIPAETIRTGIVMDPGFMGANMARDTVSGFVQADRGTTLLPVLSSLEGMKSAMTGSERYKLARDLGGDFADMWHGDSKEAHHTLKRMAKIGKFRPGTIVNPASYWRLLRRIGSLTETGTRQKAFEKQFNLAPTDPGNALLSAMQKREISVDFGLHGTSKTIRVLERLTPFLNPAKQGLYKMGRVIGDQPLTTLLRGAPLIAMSYYLWFINRDEDWYKDLENWEKNHYWHADIGLRSKHDDVIPLRIPKPFEYGALFGSFPEALFEHIATEEGEETLERTASTVEDVFLLRGYPTSLALPTELFFNRSLFTERDIVPAYLSDIDPKYQYGAHTSTVSRLAGEQLGLSPMKLDHTIRGVFGTLGVYALMAADDPLAKLTGTPRKPSSHWWQAPGIRRFFSDPLRGGGKAMTEFYDDLERYRMEQRTWEYLDFDTDYLNSLDDKSSFILPAQERISKLMSTLRKANRDIRERKDLTRDQKREMIDANTRQLRSISVLHKKTKNKIKEAENASQ